jgi:hypothetical protein
MTGVHAAHMRHRCSELHAAEAVLRHRYPKSTKTPDLPPLRGYNRNRKSQYKKSCHVWGEQRLVNLHALRALRALDRRHLGPVGLVAGRRLFVHVRLQALVEVVCAHARHDNGEEQQQDRQNGEYRQRLARGLVLFLAARARNVHADELEEEVGEGDEVDEDDDNHAGDRLAADPEGGGEEQEEGDDEGDGRQGELDRGGVLDDDEELDGEGEEEEKVKLEQGNVNLRRSAWLN